MGVDDGYVSVFGTERGPAFYNKFDESTFNFGGGFSYLQVPQNDEVIRARYVFFFSFSHIDSSFQFTPFAVNCSAFKFAPTDALPTSSRIFGVGYFQHGISLGDFQVSHRLYAPFGFDPVIIDEVTITPLSSSP